MLSPDWIIAGTSAIALVGGAVWATITAQMVSRVKNAVLELQLKIERDLTQLAIHNAEQTAQIRHLSSDLEVLNKSVMTEAHRTNRSLMRFEGRLSAIEGRRRSTKTKVQDERTEELTQ